MEQNERTPFQQALLDATLESYADIPAEAEIDAQFSRKFLHQSDTLLNNARKGKSQRTGKNLGRILLVAAILAALTTTALAVPAIREALIKFFAKDAETHYEFYFDPEQAATAPEHVEKVYKPTYIPDGFCEDFIFIDLSGAAYTWLSENGDYITFDQMIIPNDTEGPAPDAEDVVVEILCLNGYQVFCVYSDGYTMYHWTDNAYFYQLIMGPSVSEEDCERIFYSIAIDENAVIPTS